MNRKVAVIGLDGISWQILNEVFDHGAMPALNRMVKRSLRGVLKSTIPPMTPPAWTTIASGVNPGKHGVFDFVIYRKNKETRITTSLDVRYPRVNEMVAIKGLRSVCINQPFTYPPTKIKNTMTISDWIGPRVAYYPKFLRRFAEKYSSYIQKSKSESKQNFLSRFHNETLERVNVVNAIMEEVDWNLFWVVYSEPDHLLHRFYADILRGEKRMLNVLDELDTTIRKASEVSDLTLVVSDHGFSNYDMTIEVNSLLYKLGLAAKTHKEVVKGFSELKMEEGKSTLIPLPSLIYKILSTPWFKRRIKRIYELLTGEDWWRLGTKFPYADPLKSKAFLPSRTSFGIFVNQENLVQSTLETLRELDVFGYVFRRDEVYRGPYVEKAPHIIVLPKFDEGCTRGTTRITPTTTSKGNVYDHHPDGVFIIYGDEMGSKWIRQAEAADIVPTILNYLGLPIPVDTDGKPIQGFPFETKKLKRYNYLNHWLLTKKLSTVKAKLSQIQGT